MIKKIARLPVRVLSFVAAKVMGRNTAPAADAPPPPPPPRRKPAPPPARAEGDHDHDHGHDHGGGHDHGHEHAPEPRPAAQAAGPKPTVVADDTPNPNARKFTCSVRVVEAGSLSFTSAAEAAAHPLGKAIFEVGGVKGVFAVKDFVTVTKSDDADWAKLTPKLVKAIQSAL